MVDRRLVVDGAHEHAIRIRDRLEAAARGDGPPVLQAVAARLSALSGAAPLSVVRLRGGMPREESWARSPLQPTLLLSTVDQVGSRLLFRGYGVGEYARPLHAGLLAEDSLLLLDEAHLSAAFLQSLRAIGDYLGGRWREMPAWRPLVTVTLSATQATTAEAIRLDPASDGQHPLLARRLRARKPARLCSVAEAGLVATLVSQARELATICEQEDAAAGLEASADSEGTWPVIGVVVNRVATARAVQASLLEAGCESVLLIGRQRPLDRDALLCEYLPRMRAGRAHCANPRTLFVVATQTVEVGADLDFNALVTQSAPLDALRQRFGRLNRLGEREQAPAAIVHPRDAARLDPIYGQAISATWRWLSERAAKPLGSKGRKKSKAEPEVDFGVTALENLLPATGLPQELTSRHPRAPLLLPAHVDLLSQTSPAPACSPDVALLLHGVSAAPAEVQVLWRADLPADLDDEDTQTECVAAVAALPPSSLETLSLPVWVARAWLQGAGLAEPETDLEGIEPEQAQTIAPTRRRLALRWAGEESRLVHPRELRPGDTLIVPSSYGGLDRFGWNPSARAAVADLAEPANRLARDRLVLRLAPPCIAQWSGEAELVAICRGVIAALVADPDAPARATDVMVALEEIEGLPQAVRTTLAAFSSPRLLRYGSGSIAGWLLVDRRAGRVASDEGDDASLTREVPLDEHCRGVGRVAKDFAAALGLPAELVTDLALAGEFHDLGKADPRFQAWLRGGDRLATRGAPLLAKSGMDRSDRWGLRRARDLAGYPAGARHECASVQLLRSHPELLAGAHDPELVEYLVGSHHGRGRPFMPVIDDPGAGQLNTYFEALGWELHLEGPHRLERLGSGWTELYWRLVRRYGWWGLAYLETLLRLADHRRSELEQESTEWIQVAKLPSLV